MMPGLFGVIADGWGGIPTDYLFYYTMDNISGTTLNDEGGTYNGTIGGATTSAGIDGNALSFDGVNDSVVTDLTAESNLTALAVSVWVKVDDDSSNRFIFGHGGEADPNGQRFIATVFNDDSVIFDIDNAETGRISAAFPPARFGLWTHLVFTYDGTTQAIYESGALLNSRTQAGLSLDYTINLRLGSYEKRNSPFTVYYANVELDQFRHYRRGLTTDEIAALAAEF